MRDDGCKTCGQPVIGMGPFGTLLECHPDDDAEVDE